MQRAKEIDARRQARTGCGTGTGLLLRSQRTRRHRRDGGLQSCQRRLSNQVPVRASRLPPRPEACPQPIAGTIESGPDFTADDARSLTGSTTLVTKSSRRARHESSRHEAKTAKTTQREAITQSRHGAAPDLIAVAASAAPRALLSSGLRLMIGVFGSGWTTGLQMPPLQRESPAEATPLQFGLVDRR